jgi:hypothetical protein
MSDSQPYETPWSGQEPPSLPPQPQRTGPPWEQGGPAFERFLRTAKAVLLEPAALFAGMRREGGLQAPLLYAVVGLTAGAVVASAYNVLLSGLSLGPFADWDGRAGTSSLLVALVVTPIIGAVAAFVAAGIYHVMLLLLDGARYPFETTFRVQSYVMGSTALLSFVPFCGSFVGAVWGIVCAIVGLARAHEIGTGKAAAAVLIPAVVCCFVVAALAVLLGLSVLALIGAARA